MRHTKSLKDDPRFTQIIEDLALRLKFPDAFNGGIKGSPRRMELLRLNALLTYETSFTDEFIAEWESGKVPANWKGREEEFAQTRAEVLSLTRFEHFEDNKVIEEIDSMYLTDPLAIKFADRIKEAIKGKAEDVAPTLDKRIIEWLLNYKIIALVVLIVILIISIGEFTGALENIYNFYKDIHIHVEQSYLSPNRKK